MPTSQEKLEKILKKDSSITYIDEETNGLNIKKDNPTI